MQAKLPTTMLGRTGLEVTRLGFGTALYGSNRPQWTEERANTVMNTAIDQGINILDSSNDYKKSEQWIGRFLGSRNGEFYVATKCGCTDTMPTENNSEHVWTRENLFRGLEESLGRLKRDSLDVIQLHNPTVQQCEAGGLAEALSDMRAQGSVRWLGVSTTLPDLPTFLDWGVFDVMQIPYSALEREHEDWITKVAEQGVGIIIRGGVAQGEHGVGTGGAGKWRKFEEAGLDELLEQGESRSAFVLRYTLTHPHAHTNVVATTSVEHLQENVRAVRRGPLPDATFTEAKRRLDAIGERPAPVV